MNELYCETYSSYLQAIFAPGNHFVASDPIQFPKFCMRANCQRKRSSRPLKAMCFALTIEYPHKAYTEKA